MADVIGVVIGMLIGWAIVQLYTEARYRWKNRRGKRRATIVYPPTF